MFVDSVGTGMSARASRALMARGSGCLAWYGVDEMRMLCQLLRRCGIDVKIFHLPFQCLSHATWYPQCCIGACARIKCCPCTVAQRGNTSR